MRGEFQFQNGTIRRVRQKPMPLLSFSDFNSKMVRLEGGVVSSSSNLITIFQFQNGTIRRYLGLFRIETRGYFNSKMVRLEGFHQVIKGCKSFYFNSKMVRLEGYSICFLA